METILKEILKELQYQTRLMENLYHRGDAANNSAKEIHKNVTKLMTEISDMPGMNSPQAKNLLKNLLNVIPGGKK